MSLLSLNIAQIGFAAAHVALCLFLLWASRRTWSGWIAIFAGLIFQLPLVVLEIASVVLAGEAALQNDFKPWIALALVPFAAFLWWGSRANNANALMAMLRLPAMPSRAAWRGAMVLLSGLAVEVAILAVTLSVLWTLLGSVALFGANAMVPGPVASLALKSFMTAAPAFEAAGAVSVTLAILAYGVTWLRDRPKS